MWKIKHINYMTTKTLKFTMLIKKDEKDQED